MRAAFGCGAAQGRQPPSEQRASLLLQRPGRALGITSRPVIGQAGCRPAFVLAKSTSAGAAPAEGRAVDEGLPRQAIHLLHLNKEERKKETQRRISEARQRMAAAQQRLGHASASAAAAASSGAATQGKAAAALRAVASSGGSGVTAAALAMARQEASRADEAASAVFAAVADEADRQHALLAAMQSQLDALKQRSMNKKKKHPALRAAAAANESTASAPLRASLAGSQRGAGLCVVSASGAGRQLLVATGRVVAAAAVATAAKQHAAATVAAAHAGVPAGAMQGQLAGQQGKQGQQDYSNSRQSPPNLLPAPKAHLPKGLGSLKRSRRSGEDGAAGSKGNRYDMMLDLLASLAAGEKADSRYDMLRDLLAAAPPSGMARYDFARSMLRGLAAADVRGTSPFDMAAGLLQRLHAGEIQAPSGGSQWDPVWPLLHEATLLQDWGPPADSKFDPWRDVVASVQAWEGEQAARVASKYDPWSSVAAAARDPAWHGPTGHSKYCMVSAALDAAAGWQPPTGHSRYCPVSELLCAEAPAAPQSGAARWDPLAWLLAVLLDGWAANSSQWEVQQGGSVGTSRDDDAMYALA